MKRFLTVLATTAILFPLSVNSAIQGDINDDGRIDTSEAIYALQVASGLYPGVSASCLLNGKGAWSPSTVYAECDVVSSSDGENYVCKVSHTSSDNTFNNDTANWTLLSLKGDKGDPGHVGQAKGLSIGNEVIRTIGTTTYTWLDRNLGARQLATTYNDTNAYGDLYQWGRGGDGHESRTSPTTTVVSSSDTPKHDNFITGSTDWRNPQNDNLWNGVSGINNPCPAGFRLPTELEWEAERLAWVSEDGNENNDTGAFASPLKLVLAGLRQTNGQVSNEGFDGYYWSSTVNIYSRYLYIYTFGAYMTNDQRATGHSVRCIKD